MGGRRERWNDRGKLQHCKKAGIKNKTPLFFSFFSPVQIRERRKKINASKKGGKEKKKEVKKEMATEVVWGEEEQQKRANQGLIVEEIEEEQKDRWWRERPRKGRIQADVIWNFFNSEDREHWRKATHIFFEHDTLYSYGYHFRLAVRVKRGIKSDFVINSDKYSVTTSGHQCLTRSYAPEGTPSLSISACWNAGIDLSKVEILDMRGDRWETKYCLFRDGDDYYLAGIEQGKRRWETYNFLVELYEPATLLSQALKQISGLNDEDWEAYQRGEIKRQGEYFFKPVGTTKELKREKGVQKVMVQKHVDLNKVFRKGMASGLTSLFTGARNSHIATELTIIGDTEVFVRGTVRHREHPMIRLGKIWHKVTTNYIKGSWRPGAVGD